MDKSQLLAAKAVGQVLGGRNLTQVLDQTWRSQAGLTPQQRSAAQDMSYGALRYYGALRAMLDQLLERPLQDDDVRCLLLVAMYQLEYGKSSSYAVVDHAVRAVGALKKPWAKGLVNAVLRNFLRRRESLLAAIAENEVSRYSYPQWWINKLKRQYPEHWQAMLEVGNQRPPMTLRVNRRRLTAAAYLQELGDAGIEASLLGDSAVMLAQPLPVDRLPGFLEGEVSVQDYGAQFAAPLLDLQPGMRVLDACCAPGGKTCHILESAAIEMTAVDNEVERLERTRSNLARLDLSANLVLGDAATTALWGGDLPQFDRILADVPCTASGIVRRHADIKWLRREQDIAHFTVQQALILRALWQVLAKGGKLLYATCSVFVEENQSQIDAFLQERTDAQQLPLPGLMDGQLLPCTEHDGFFYALLQKN